MARFHELRPEDRERVVGLIDRLTEFPSDSPAALVSILLMTGMRKRDIARHCRMTDSAVTGWQTGRSKPNDYVMSELRALVEWRLGWRRREGLCRP